MNVLIKSSLRYILSEMLYCTHAETSVSGKDASCHVLLEFVYRVSGRRRALCFLFHPPYLWLIRTTCIVEIEAMDALLPGFNPALFDFRSKLFATAQSRCQGQWPEITWLVLIHFTWLAWFISRLSYGIACP